MNQKNYSNKCPPEPYKAPNTVHFYERNFHTIGNLNPLDTNFRNLSNTAVDTYLIEQYSNTRLDPRTVKALAYDNSRDITDKAITNLSQHIRELAQNDHGIDNIDSLIEISDKEQSLLTRGFEPIFNDPLAKLSCWKKYATFPQNTDGIELELISNDLGLDCNNVSIRFTTPQNKNSKRKLDKALQDFMRSLNSADATNVDQSIKKIMRWSGCKVAIKIHKLQTGLDYIKARIGEIKNPLAGTYNAQVDSINQANPGHKLDLMMVKENTRVSKLSKSLGSILFPDINATFVDTDSGRNQWEQLKVTTIKGAVFAEFIAASEHKRSFMKLLGFKGSPASLKFQIGFKNEALDTVYNRLEQLFPLMSQDVLEKGQKVTVKDSELLDKLLAPTAEGQGTKLVSAHNLKFLKINWPYADLSGTVFKDCWFKDSTIIGDANKTIFDNCRASGTRFEFYSSEGMVIKGANSFFDASCSFYNTFQAYVTGRFAADIHYCSTYTGLKFGYSLTSIAADMLKDMVYNAEVLKRDCPKIFTWLARRTEKPTESNKISYDGLKALPEYKLFNTIGGPELKKALTEIGAITEASDPALPSHLGVQLSHGRLLYLKKSDKDPEIIKASMFSLDFNGTCIKHEAPDISTYQLLSAVAKISALNEVYSPDKAYEAEMQELRNKHILKSHTFREFSRLIEEVIKEGTNFPHIVNDTDVNGQTLVEHLKGLRNLQIKQELTIAKLIGSNVEIEEFDYLALAQAIVGEVTHTGRGTQGDKGTCAGATINDILAIEAPAEFSRLAIFLTMQDEVELNSSKTGKPYRPKDLELFLAAIEQPSKKVSASFPGTIDQELQKYEYLVNILLKEIPGNKSQDYQQYLSALEHGLQHALDTWAAEYVKLKDKKLLIEKFKEANEDNLVIEANSADILEAITIQDATERNVNIKALTSQLKYMLLIESLQNVAKNKLDDTKILKLPSNFVDENVLGSNPVSGKPSFLDARMQAAVLYSFPDNSVEEYCYNTDTFIDKDGHIIEFGMTNEAIKKALNALIPNRTFKIIEDLPAIQSALSNKNRSRGVAALAWPKDTAQDIRTAEGHAVTIELPKNNSTRIFFRNPHGASDTPKGQIIPGPGPIGRKMEDPDIGLESMELADFKKYCRAIII